MPWTVLHLAQRMGRILRPWHKVRSLEIYNFLSDTMKDENIAMAGNWMSRLEKRTQDYSSFSELPVLLKNAKNEIQFFELSRQLMSNKESDLDLNDALKFIESADEIRTSSALDDLSEISESEFSRISSIRKRFRSVAKIEKPEKKMFLLAEVQTRTYACWFNEDASFYLNPNHQTEVLQFLKEYSRFKKSRIWRF